jgi:hypothetical protein
LQNLSNHEDKSPSISTYKGFEPAQKDKRWQLGPIIKNIAFTKKCAVASQTINKNKVTPSSSQSGDGRAFIP